MGVFLLLGAAAASWVGRWDPGRVLGVGEAFHESLASGESLLHGLPTDSGITYRLPMAGLALSLYRNHAGPKARAWTAALVGSAVPALCWELGLLLAGPLAGAGAALAACLPFSFNEAGGHEEQVYGILVLLAAVLAAWRAKRPSPGRSAALGLAVAVSVLCRSPLFFFPFVLAAWELAGLSLSSAGRGGRSGPAAGRAWGPAILGWAFLCLLPCAFLVPWWELNWALHGRFIPFEHGRADSNLVTGALGLVPTVVGDYASLAGIAPGESALSWASAEVAAHPLRYAGGVLARLWFFLRLHPVLLALGAAGLWLGRRRAGFGAAAGLASFFVLLHCLLSVERRYFEPVWPILAALACAGLGSRFSPEPRPEEERAKPWAALGLGAPALVLASAAGLLAWTYPGRAARLEESFSRAIAGHPRDPWPLYLRGLWRLKRGEPVSAAADLAAAKALEPGHFPFEFAHLWALTAAGRVGPEGVDRAAAGWAKGLEYDWPPEYKSFAKTLLVLLWALDRGDAARAGRLKTEAAALWRPNARLTAAAAGVEEDSLRRLQEGGRATASRLAELARAWPAARRLALHERLAALFPGMGLEAEAAAVAEELGAFGRALRLVEGPGGGDGPERCLRLAALELKLGRKAAARARLESLSRWEPGADIRARAAVLWQESGEPRRAWAILDRLVAERPRDARLRSSRGVAAALSGRVREAADDFREAIRLDPGLPAAYLSLGGLEASAGEREAALRTFRAGLARAGRGGDPAILRLLEAEARRLEQR